MKQILLLLVIFFTTNLAAQNSATAEKNTLFDPFPHDEVPMGAPEWFDRLNDKNVNFFEMEKRFKEYLDTNPDARAKRNGTKPIVNYYRRWAKAYTPYVKPDGSIRLPSVQKVLRSLDAQNRHAAQMKARAAQTASARQWKVIGPFITYDYKHKKITPNQVNVLRLDVAETNTSTLYCGTQTGMVFKSTDKGQNWNACAFDHDFGGAVLAVKIDPKNESVVYVGSEYFLWKTTDGGNTWTRPAGWNADAGQIDDIEIDPLNSQNVWIAAMSGLYKSTDGGNTFGKPALSAAYSQRAMDIKFNPVHKNELYTLIKQNGFVVLYKSDNSGASFSQINLGMSNIIAGRLATSTAQEGKYLYALVTTSTQAMPRHLAGPPRILKSTDFGETWTVNNGYFKCQAMSNQDEVRGGQGYYDMAIAASNTNPEHIVYGLTDIYASTDGGITGRNLGGYCGTMDLHVDIQDLRTVGDEVWMSTDGGINYSTDFFNTHHEVRTRGIYASDFWGFDQAWNEDIMVGGRFHNGDMAQTDFYDNKSIAIAGAEEATGYVFLSNPRKVAFSDAPDVILPDNWQDDFPTFNFTKIPIESQHYGTGLEFDPRFAMCFIQSDEKMPNTLWQTTDDGESYTELYTFPTEIRDYRVARSNPNRIVVATAYKIHKSDDGGKTFAELTLPASPDMINYRYRVAIHPENADEIWITNMNTNGLYRSTDGGNSWTLLMNGLASEDRAMGMVLTGDKKNGAYIFTSQRVDLGGEYALAYCKVFYRDDENPAWVNVSNGLPAHIFIIKMVPFYKKGVLRVASDKGIWELPLIAENAKPIAQPIMLNTGKQTVSAPEMLHFDSYSIVNQEGAAWKWSFSPEPAYISDATARNPKIRPSKKGFYNVTLTVTTPDGQTSTKTEENMFRWDGTEASTNVETGRQNNVEIINSGQSLYGKIKNVGGKKQITINNAAGATIHTQTIAADAEEFSISTASWSKGVYFYTLQADNFRKIGKFLVR